MQKLFVKYGFDISLKEIEEIYILFGKKDLSDPMNFEEFKKCVQNERINLFFKDLMTRL